MGEVLGELMSTYLGGQTSVRWLDLYKTFATLIKEDYGPRCPEVEGGCPVCQMWALYDLLVASVCADDDEEEPNDQVGKGPDPGGL